MYKDSNYTYDLYAILGCDRMVVGYLQLLMQSVPITTDVMSSNLNQDEVHNIT